MAESVLGSLIPSAVSAGYNYLTDGVSNMGFGPENKTSITSADELVSIDFDCTYDAGITLSAKISEYPVEDGSPISDHVQVGSLKVTVNGEFTSCTWGVIGSLTEDPSRILDVENLYTSSYSGLARMQKAKDTLISMIKNQTALFTLVTPYDVFPNLAVSDLSIKYDSPRELFKFGMTLVTIALTALEWGQLVQGSPKKSVANKGGKTKAPVGVKSKAPVEHKVTATRNTRQVRFKNSTHRDTETATML